MQPRLFQYRFLSLHANHAATKKSSYDVDERDFFWDACGSFAFPKLAEEVEVQLKAYRAAVEEINAKTTAGPQVSEYVGEGGGGGGGSDEGGGRMWGW